MRGHVCSHWAHRYSSSAFQFLASLKWPRSQWDDASLTVWAEGVPLVDEVEQCSNSAVDSAVDW